MESLVVQTVCKCTAIPYLCYPHMSSYKLNLLVGKTMLAYSLVQSISSVVISSIVGAARFTACLTAWCPLARFD